MTPLRLGTKLVRPAGYQRAYLGTKLVFQIATATAPPVPTGLTLTTATGEATATWNASTGAASYRLRRRMGTGQWLEVGVSGTSRTIVSLTDGDTWEFQVRARNDVGDSAWSAGVSITVGAADLMPTFGQSTIDDQSWPEDVAITDLVLPAATGGDGALVYSLSPGLPAGLAFDAATRTISGTPTTPVAAAAYTYTVTDADGDTATLTFDITITAAARVPPSAVRNLVVRPGVGQFTATFDPPAQGSPTRYRLRYIIPPATSGHTTGVHASSPITITGLVNGTTYSVQVRAEDISQTDGNLFGPWSAAIEVTPASALPVADAPSVTIDAVADGEEGTSATLGATISGGTYDALDYAWTASVGTLDDATAVAPTWTRPSVDTDTEATIGLTVTARGTGTIARNNTSDPQAAADVTTTVTAAADPPGIPTSVSVVAGDGQLLLQWSAPASGGDPTGYRIDWAADSTIVGNHVAAHDDVNYIIPNLTNGTEYTIRIRAQNGAGNSAYVTVLGTPVLAAPGVPRSLAATAGDGQLVLTWVAPATGGAVRDYRIEWAAGSTALGNHTLAGLTYTITGLTNGTEITVRVRAQNSTANSSYVTIRATPAVPDTAPSFGAATIPNLTLDEDAAFSRVLPVATGGNGTLTYSITGTLPTGLAFTAASRTLAGTPTVPAPAVSLTYTVTDEDGDTDTISFTVAISAVSGLTGPVLTLGQGFNFSNESWRRANWTYTAPDTHVVTGYELAQNPHRDGTAGWQQRTASPTAGTGGVWIIWDGRPSVMKMRVRAVLLVQADGSIARSQWTELDVTALPSSAEGSPIPAYIALDDAPVMLDDVPLRTIEPQTEPPPAPSLVAVSPGDGQIALSWFDTDSNVTHYRVWYKPGDESATFDGVTEISPSPTTASATITGLANGTEYAFWISAVNAHGESARAGPFNATPAAP